MTYAQLVKEITIAPAQASDILYSIEYDIYYLESSCEDIFAVKSSLSFSQANNAIGELEDINPASPVEKEDVMKGNRRLILLEIE